MALFATVHQVNIGEHDLPEIYFSLHDGDDSGMISFNDTIGQAHATFLVDHGMITGDSAYAQMLRAFVEAEDAHSLVDRDFTSDIEG